MTRLIGWGQDIAPKYQAVEHPYIAGAWTVAGPDNPAPIMIANKARAEAIATGRNLQRDRRSHHEQDHV